MAIFRHVFQSAWFGWTWVCLCASVWGFVSSALRYIDTTIVGLVLHFVFMNLIRASFVEQNNHFESCTKTKMEIPWYIGWNKLSNDKHRIILIRIIHADSWQSSLLNFKVAIMMIKLRTAFLVGCSGIAHISLEKFWCQLTACHLFFQFEDMEMEQRNVPLIIIFIL